MAEDVFEVYSDSFDVVGNSYGIVINFQLSHPTAHSQHPAETVARIRLSWEMAKVLNYIFLRLIKKTEDERGVSYPIPLEILNSLKIAKEDWDSFWFNPPFAIGGDQE